VSQHKTLTELMIPPVGITHQALEAYRAAIAEYSRCAEYARLTGNTSREHHYRCEVQRIAKLIPREHMLQVVSVTPDNVVPLRRSVP
jgi:hypothetical protein